MKPCAEQAARCRAASRLKYGTPAAAVHRGIDAEAKAYNLIAQGRDWQAPTGDEESDPIAARRQHRDRLLKQLS